MAIKISFSSMKIRQFDSFLEPKNIVFVSKDNTIYFNDGYYHTSNPEHKISNKELFVKPSPYVLVNEIKFKHYVLFYFVNYDLNSRLVSLNMKILSRGKPILNLLKLYLTKLII